MTLEVIARNYHGFGWIVKLTESDASPAIVKYIIQTTVSGVVVVKHAGPAGFVVEREFPGHEQQAVEWCCRQCQRVLDHRSAA